MDDVWSDPTAVGATYPDPSAPQFVAPIVRPEPDPVFRDDALFASASLNWRAAPVPPPPLPVLDESGRLVLIAPPVQPPPPPPSAAMLRDQAVAALKAPPAHYQAPASRGGSRSTYTAPPPPRPSRRPPPARPPGSVTSSPSTWLPVQSQPAASAPTATAPWQPSPPPPTWQPLTSDAPPAGRNSGPIPYRIGQRPRAARTGRRPSKGWIPGLVVLLVIIGANVGPHLSQLFHHAPPGGVDAAVNAYYSDVEGRQPASAAGLICAAKRSTWTRGQTSATSDSRRGVVDHSIRSTTSAGSGQYTVVVDLNLKTQQPSVATVTVRHEDGAYHLCGGTSP